MSGYGAFGGCSSLKTIICKAIQAPSVDRYSFGDPFYLAYAGSNTHDTGENTLYVPAGATGYDKGEWLDPLQNAQKCGFTLSATL